MKKSISLVLILVVLLSFGGLAYGETSTGVLEQVQHEVNETNEEIDELIEQAISDSIKIVDEYDRHVALAEKELKARALKERLTSLLENKNVQIENLITNLVNETNALAQEMFELAEALGVEVICELVPVEIDGQIIMIDPLRVVGT